MALESSILNQFLTEVAETIRLKKEIDDTYYPIVPNDFSLEILEIETDAVTTNVNFSCNTESNTQFYATVKDSETKDLILKQFTNNSNLNVVINSLVFIILDNTQDLNFISINDNSDTIKIIAEMDNYLVIQIGSKDDLEKTIQIHYVLPSE